MDSTKTERRESNSLNTFAGGGEMGKAISAMDWSKNPLGPVESWSPELQTTVNLALASTFPICIVWGSGHNQIYNDGYVPICGGKHPVSMGQDFRKCWEEAFPVIGAAYELAWTGKSSFLENQRIFLDRYGFIEETFFTLSFSPIRDKSGNIAGLFHPVIEATERMLSERRARTLRDLVERSSTARTIKEAFRLVTQTLASYELDLPFVLIYQADHDMSEFRLVEACGLDRGKLISQEEIKFNFESENGWPLSKVFQSKQAIVVENLSKIFNAFECKPYPEAPSSALAMSIYVAGVDLPLGVIIAGVSPRLPLDETYRDFYALLSNTINNVIGNARAYEEEKKRAEALAEIDRAKTAFFSNVSHEFRTPLTLMLGPLEDNLADSKFATLPIEHQKREALAYRNAQRLLKLVNSLLDFSRIEAGRIVANYSPTELSKLTLDLSSVFRSAIEKAGLKFTVDISDLEEDVYVDVEMWEKIVLNLLSNAFKFTFAGEIVLKLARLGDSAIFSIKDTGTGVSELELPRLFERFHRVEGAKGRTHEGTGIGLALVQELIKLHGGAISVKTKIGEGTEFIVEIPFGKKHLPANQVVENKFAPESKNLATTFVDEALRWLPSSDQPSNQELTVNPIPKISSHNKSEKMRVLFADDNSDMRSYIKNLLSSEWEVETVNDGQEALESALNRPPDLVLTDIMMPRMNGMELLQNLKHHPKTKHISVILLSARAGEEAQLGGLEAGADDYLVKPFSAKELMARVRTHLQISRMKAEANRQRENIYSVFMQAPVGICVLDGPEHIFILSNDDYYSLLGGMREIIGKPIREALPELAGQGFYEILDKVYRTGEPFVGRESNVNVVLEDGSLKNFFVNVTYQPKHNSEGEIDGILVVAIDVTTQVLARKKIELLANELQSAVRARDDFLSISSHELRTPITSLKMQLQFSRKGVKPGEGLVPSPEKLAKALDMSIRQVDRLEALIDDLLDVSRVESGKMTYNFEKVNISGLVKEVLERFSEQLKAAKCPLESFNSENVTITCDRFRIEQVVTNLISNALKYGSGSLIKIEVEPCPVGARIRVSDRGMGIQKEKHGLIFGRFERAVSNSNISGLGLGLYITKQIVDAHGGKISLESEIGKGTTFTVDLIENPLMQPEDEQ